MILTTRLVIVMAVRNGVNDSRNYAGGDMKPLRFNVPCIPFINDGPADLAKRVEEEEKREAEITETKRQIRAGEPPPATPDIW